MQKQGKIIGFVIGCCEQRDEDKIFFIKEICVISNKQRQGMGTKLIQNLLSRLDEIGVNLIYLLLMLGYDTII